MRRRELDRFERSGPEFYERVARRVPPAGRRGTRALGRGRRQPPDGAGRRPRYVGPFRSASVSEPRRAGPAAPRRANVHSWTRTSGTTSWASPPRSRCCPPPRRTPSTPTCSSGRPAARSSRPPGPSPACVIDPSGDAVGRDARLARSRRAPGHQEVHRVGAAIAKAQAEEIVRLAALTPVEGHRKVLILDEFHLLRPEGAARLLKTIEEPPPSTVFVIVADDVPLDLVTIASRCVRVDFQPLPEPLMAEVLEQEGAAPETALASARAAAGQPGPRPPPGRRSGRRGPDRGLRPAAATPRRQRSRRVPGRRRGDRPDRRRGRPAQGPPGPRGGRPPAPDGRAGRAGIEPEAAGGAPQA